MITYNLCLSALACVTTQIWKYTTLTKTLGSMLASGMLTPHHVEVTVPGWVCVVVTSTYGL